MAIGTVRQKLGTCVIIVDQQNRVLLGKRLRGVFPGYYGMPGGSIEPGESPLAGAEREADEETSLKLENFMILAVMIEHEDPPTNDYIHFGILCTEFTGTPVLTGPNECAGWEWYPLDQLPSPMVPAHLAILKYYSTCQSNPKLSVLEISNRKK